jgi:hypothetical protein
VLVEELGRITGLTPLRNPTYRTTSATKQFQMRVKQ